MKKLSLPITTTAATRTSLEDSSVDDDYESEEDDDKFADLGSDDMKFATRRNPRVNALILVLLSNVKMANSSSCADDDRKAAVINLFDRGTGSIGHDDGDANKKARETPRTGAPAAPIAKHSNPPGQAHYPINNVTLALSRLKQDVAALSTVWPAIVLL